MICLPWLYVLPCPWEQIVVYFLVLYLLLTLYLYIILSQYQVQVSMISILASLHFARNYSRNVSKTLQSWCASVILFPKTSVLPWCDLFYDAYEKSLKALEINCILSESRYVRQPNNWLVNIHPQMDVYWCLQKNLWQPWSDHLS